MTPLVTVGIPCYNVERFIGYAIRSVLNQTYTNFELIITDDGSTDGTVDVIKQFNDPRIKLIVDGENHGISYRLNQQIDLAQGEYFVRMDGDDIMFPNRIEEQIKYLQEHPDVSVVSGQAIIIDDNNLIIGKRTSAPKPMRLTLNNWLSGMRLTHPSVCGRTDFFWEYQYSDRYKGVEDADLWFRSCSENKLIILPNFMIFYRDPLQLKLSTYCFRQKQARQSRLNYYKEGKLSFKFVVKLLFRSYLREIIYGLSSLFGWDNKLLSRRNQAISKLDKERFEHLLHHIIITNTH